MRRRSGSGGGAAWKHRVDVGLRVSTSGRPGPPAPALLAGQPVDGAGGGDQSRATSPAVSQRSRGASPPAFPSPSASASAPPSAPPSASASRRARRSSVHCRPGQLCAGRRRTDSSGTGAGAAAPHYRDQASGAAGRHAVPDADPAQRLAARHPVRGPAPGAPPHGWRPRRRGGRRASRRAVPGGGRRRPPSARARAGRALGADEAAPRAEVGDDLRPHIGGRGVEGRPEGTGPPVVRSRPSAVGAALSTSSSSA